MNRNMWVGVCAAVAAFPALAIQTAGDLLINLNASALALNDNDKVTTWVNDGTLGGYYTNVTAGQGAVFNTSVAGVAAVSFLPNANWSVMTNVVAVPSSICGTEPWSFEIWVYNPNLSQTEVVFSWTARNNWPGGIGEGSCVEFRYGGDAGNAVEHYGSGGNMTWNGAVPMPGLWHHVACTRDAEGRERLYVNGQLRNVFMPPRLNVRNDGVFSLGGVRNLTGTFDSLFGGSIARLRIHDGTLSESDVTANYLEERAAFGVADVPDTMWTGAVTQALPWENAANWSTSELPGQDSRVAIANGGTAVVSTAVGEVGRFFPYHGSLVLEDGALLVAPPKQGSNVSLGSASNSLFNLTVRGGVFNLPDATNGQTLYIGHNSGIGNVVVGGGSGPAVLDVGRDIRVGQGTYSIGRLTIENGGVVCCSNGTFYIGADGLADARVTVNGGFLGYRTRGRDMIVGHNTSYSVLEINDGVVMPSQDLVFTHSAASARCTGIAQLNGGLLQARRIYPNNTAGTNIVYMNGGTIRNVDTRNDFFYNLDWAYVQPGGARFEIIPNTLATASQPLLRDPALGDGGLTKTGNGTLVLSGANTFTGGIHVAAGHLCLSNAAALPAGYAAPITMDDGGSIGYPVAGALQNTVLPRIPVGSSGAVIVYAQNAAENIDFSSHPNLGIGFAAGVTYTGTYTPFNQQYIFAPVGQGNVYSQTLTDGAGVGSVILNGDPFGVLELTGDNSYSGGTTINRGILSMGHVNALGLPSATPDIGIYNGAGLKLNNAAIAATIVQRIKPDSDGSIVLGAACAGLNIDLTGLPGVRLGTDQGTLTYSGVLTPDGTVYRTGGGRLAYASGNLGLVITNLTNDGATPRTLVIDSVGMVCPSNATHTGGTVVTNAGAIHVRGDHALGAVPSTYTPANLYVDGGVLRPGNLSFTLNANRGITVGPNGMILHQYGSQTMTVNGGLHGSGAITNTDSGTVTLAGTGNTYDGALTLTTGTINIGNGSNFSWNPDAWINGWGGTLAINYNGNLAWSTAMGNPLGMGGFPNFGFRKSGNGTLTADVPQVYTGTTTIEAGVLKVATSGAVPTGVGRGGVSLSKLNYSSTGTLDVNGHTVTLNSLSGPGSVTDSTATASTLYVGNNNGGSNFRGTVAPGLSLTKIGNGMMLLSKGTWMNELSVLGGSVSNAPGVEVAGTVTVNAGATLLIGAETNELYGLLGEYYDLNNAAIRHHATVTSLVSLAKFNEVLSMFMPNTVAMSAVSNVFSFGSTGVLLHNRGDNRVVRWTGRFLAQTSGEYGFDSASDDGSMVFVNGITVVSNNFSQAYGRNAARVLTPITLEAGWHDIVVAYYNGTGSYGLTVFMTPPGGVESELPQNLLRPPAVTFGALTGAPGSRTLFHSGSARLAFNATGDAVYDGRVSASNALNVVEKYGSGTQTLRRVDSAGSAEVKEGTLVLSGSPMYAGAVQAFNAGMAVSPGATLRVESHGAEWPNAGLAGSYFNIPNFSSGTFATIPSIESYFNLRIPDHLYGTHLAGSTFRLNPNSLFPPPYNSGAYNDFQVLYQGKLVVREAGTYGFFLSSDDRSDLYINGVAVLANASSGTTRSGTTNLLAGTHDILIPLQQGGGGYRIELQWTPPGATQVYVPNDALRPCVAQSGPLSAQTGAAVSLAHMGSFLRVAQTAPSVFAGAFDGPAGSEIEKAGDASLTLTGDNDAFGGNWFVSAGELWAGDGATSGTLGGSNVYVSGGASLVFNRSDDIVYPGSVSGKGLVRSAGTGKVRLGGSMAGFQGTVQIGEGQNIAIASSLTATNAVVSNDGIFGLSGAGAFMLGSRIGGSGETRLSEGATLALSAQDADFGQTLSVSNAVLALAVTNAAAAWQLDSLTIEAGTTLEVVPSGLWGKYYDIATWNTDTISNAFLSIESAEAYLALQTLSLTASTWQQGDVVDFGRNDQGGAFFPGKYNSLTGTRTTNFAVKWRGKIRITEPGLYTFATTSDDHTMLFINGALIVDNNGNHGMRTRTGTVELGVGLHDFALYFSQGGGGYGLYLDITFPGATASQRLPNAMLVAEAADTPAYTLTADAVRVVNGPGAGTVAFSGPGTLGLGGSLWVENGARLAVTGQVAVAGSALTVEVPAEVPYGVTVVGDFTGTDGLDLSGKTLALSGSDGTLRYREKTLYIVRNTGTHIMLR